MIAEQYRNIRPHFVHADHMPMVRRWSCILLDQDTENPPFEPARYFVVNVFAETKEQVLDCLGDEYPWCDIMYIDKALGGHTDDDFLEAWLHYFDAKEAIPVREAPHGKHHTGSNMKNPKQISDTTLLNFMLNDRVGCRYVLSNEKPIFVAEKGLDFAYGNTPREALRGLYILLKEKR